jgi:hypothetical protein
MIWYAFVVDDHDDSKPNLQFDDIETILKQ